MIVVNCSHLLTCRCNIFTFQSASTLLNKSVREASRNVGRKLREIHIGDYYAVVNSLVPLLFARFSCRNSVLQRYSKSVDNSMEYMLFI